MTQTYSVEIIFGKRDMPNAEVLARRLGKEIGQSYIHTMIRYSCAVIGLVRACGLLTSMYLLSRGRWRDVLVDYVVTEERRDRQL